MGNTLNSEQRSVDLIEKERLRRHSPGQSEKEITSCRELVRKLESFVEYPNIMNHDSMTSGPPIMQLPYYTGCDECKQFVDNINNSHKYIRINVRPNEFGQISRIETDVDVNKQIITYTLCNTQSKL